MKNYFVLFLAINILPSCNFIEDKKNDLATSAAEKILEKTTGMSDIEIADISNEDKSIAKVDVQVNGKNIQDKFKNAVGYITASKESIAITISKDFDGYSDNIILGFTGKDLTAKKPVKGSMKSSNSENISFQFSMSHITENGLENKLSQEAFGEITQLTDAKAIIKVSGKLYSLENYESPEKWEDFSGTITIEYPIYNAMGVKKEELNY